MHSNNPKELLQKLHLIEIELSNGLLTKDEVIDWAYEIINKEDKPDIFFIDLVLLSTKNINEIIQHFRNYLNTDRPIAQGRPLLELLYKHYKSGRFDLDQTINILYHLRSEADWSQREYGFIVVLEDYYSLAIDGIMGSIEEVQTMTENFLCLFKGYSFDNSEQWSELDKTIELKLEEESRCDLGIINCKPWWKFW